jgi:hypothetical protein
MRRHSPWMHIFAFSYLLWDIRRLTTFSLSSHFDDPSRPSTKLHDLRGFLLFISHIFIAWNSPIPFPVHLHTFILSFAASRSFACIFDLLFNVNLRFSWSPHVPAIGWHRHIPHYQHYIHQHLTNHVYLSLYPFFITMFHVAKCLDGITMHPDLVRRTRLDI